MKNARAIIIQPMKSDIPKYSIFSVEHLSVAIFWISADDASVFVCQSQSYGILSKRYCVALRIIRTVDRYRPPKKKSKVNKYRYKTP